VTSSLDIAHVVRALTGGDLPDSICVLSGAVVDSRRAQMGSLFVALAGEHADGHTFVTDAFARGASVALIDRPVAGDHSTVDLRQPMDLASVELAPPLCLLVEDTLLALQKLAAYWRKRFTPRVVGITGSVGKTTTKEVVHAVLASRYQTLKSAGNLNNEIGLPLTLLQLTPACERVVLEMGMYARGEIATLAAIGQPQVGVVTNVGPVHLERLGTIQAIADAKAELVQALPPSPEGVAILNQDDPLVRAMAERTLARVLTYGLNTQADLWADQVVSSGLGGIHFALHYGGETVSVRAPLLGRHSVHTALRAAAVGLAEGLDWSDIVSGLTSETHQLRLVAVPGPGDSLLLDDTYNASPASSIAALNLLAELDGRRVAVLGDMLELGSATEAGHRQVGRRAAEVVDLLITVGQLAEIMANEALAFGLSPDQVVVLPDVQRAVDRLPTLIRPHDMVLIKGSRGIRLDRLVDCLSYGRTNAED